MTHPHQPELLAPAGNWDCVRAAVANGADAIYFGLPRFNARLRADNFSEAELPEVVAFCHRHGVKAYVAFNTLVFTAELDDAAEYLRLLNRAGVDALIVQDIGLVRLAREIVPELSIHASTQMTITSPEGVTFAKELGIDRVVLARELSLRELEKFPPADERRSTLNAQPSILPLEVFVHGALCVAYSGQCLTSESLGQRSANRGECAQACRMPYELIVDGALRELGDRRYLLSPQDLAAVEEIPALLERGVMSFKIEGRLKSPEYVAAVCQVYRKALDAVQAADPHPREDHRPAARGPTATPADRYQLEMTFSRGLFTGWMHGVDHQQLVSARYGKKRGPFVGRIERVGRDCVEVAAAIDLKAGDGVVFDTGGDTNAEQGGRLWRVEGRRLFFERGRIDFAKLHAGDRLWKTDDPALNKRLQQSFTGRLEPRHRTPIDLRITGCAGEPLSVEVEIPGTIRVPRVGRSVSPRRTSDDPLLAKGDARPEDAGESPLRRDAETNPRDAYGTQSLHSTLLLQAARTAPLTTEKLREHLGRFGESAYTLGELHNVLEGEVILPIGELNRLRRELVYQLDTVLHPNRPEVASSWNDVFAKGKLSGREPAASSLAVLCRSMEQIEAALACGIATIYADFEDIRRYKDAVARIRAAESEAQILLATPRIQKAGEQGFFKLIENAAPDGVLIRNLGAIDYFRGHSTLRKVGDFSLNVANPLTAQWFLARGLERVTVSYDLNLEQVLDLLAVAPPDWFELTLHQHMPMFHMEHCVFAAFLSKGSSFLDCGRPCDRHRVHLRDRVGMEHPLRADVGCRNTLFNAVAQTGARFHRQLADAGLGHFRVELLEESREDSERTLRAYQSLLAGNQDGEELWRTLRAQSQLGVTRGTL
jgi:putative protease